jgi:hypothetical protein
MSVFKGNAKKDKKGKFVTLDESNLRAHFDEFDKVSAAGRWWPLLLPSKHTPHHIMGTASAAPAAADPSRHPPHPPSGRLWLPGAS